MGTECLFLSQAELAAQVAASIASVGFKNRGAKKRTDLYFLNKTDMPAILIEVCFVDSQARCRPLQRTIRAGLLFDRIRHRGRGNRRQAAAPNRRHSPTRRSDVRGKVSHFGGPEDTGVSPSEGLAFIYDEEHGALAVPARATARYDGAGAPARSERALYRDAVGL